MSSREQLSQEIKVLKQNTPNDLVPVPRTKDSVTWLESKTGTFTIKSAMKIIKLGQQRVECYKLVWWQGCVPIFFFILWLACKRRLKTKDRMKAWGVCLENTDCELCNQAKENINHLLFQSSHSSSLEESSILQLHLQRAIYLERGSKVDDCSLKD